MSRSYVDYASRAQHQQVARAITRSDASQRRLVAVMGRVAQTVKELYGGEAPAFSSGPSDEPYYVALNVSDMDMCTLSLCDAIATSDGAAHLRDIVYHPRERRLCVTLWCDDGGGAAPMPPSGRATRTPSTAIKIMREVDAGSVYAELDKSASFATADDNDRAACAHIVNMMYNMYDTMPLLHFSVLDVEGVVTRKNDAMERAYLLRFKRVERLSYSFIRAMMHATTDRIEGINVNKKGVVIVAQRRNNFAPVFAARPAFAPNTPIPPPSQPAPPPPPSSASARRSLSDGGARWARRDSPYGPPVAAPPVSSTW
jgi:hypothetical protein